MKTLITRTADPKPKNRYLVAAAACFLAGALSASATVTVQGWWHLDSTQPITDSSGNGRNFGSAFSTAPSTGGVVGAQLIANGAGGPLDGTGYTSSECIRVGVGVGGRRQSAMWNIGYNPPAQNFGIEVWILPVDNGLAPQSAGNADFFASGETGGVALRINGVPGGPSYIDAHDLGNGATIGGQATEDTNEWMEVAIVNNGGVTTFYTNGVPCGSSLATATSTSAGFVTAIASQSDNSAFYGYMDEMRMFTFTAGQFTTNDLLLRPPGPNLLASPQNAVVWNGGAAPFNVIGSFNSSLAYQWFNGATNIAGATNSSYFIPVVATAQSGQTFKCSLTASSLSVTSAPASLTVVSPNAANVAAFQDAVSNTAGLIGYFPVDGCTGTVVSNTINASFNGTLENNATYDGRTNRSFGQRALAFNTDGVVEVPNNPAYEFGSGNGTIEVLVYLSQGTSLPATIVSDNFDGSAPYYALMTDPTGGFLVYSNDSTTALSWSVPGGLVGQLALVALVINNTTNVTAYVNGNSLGTQVQTGFGSTPGGSFWIGNMGSTTSTNNGWAGTIDELSIYGAALTPATIQGHFTKYNFGTNVVPPVITAQSSSKTLLAGGSPFLSVSVTGALPITFEWTSNSIPIAGATSSTLVLPPTTTNSSATYSVVVTNVFGAATSSPIHLTFVSPPAGYVAKIMSDNPSAFWRLADASGPTAVDSAGLNDATYSGSGVTYAAGGPAADPAAGARFNGSAGRAVTPANFADINPAGPFTIEFWANLTAYNSIGTTGHFYSPMSSMPRPSRTGGYEWYMGGNSSGYEFHTAEAGNYSLLTADNNAPPTNTWWYLTGIWDGTNLYLYVNGQLGNDQIDPPAPAGTDNFAAEGLGQTQFIPNTSVPFFIGSRSDGVDYFNGAIADVAFYNYALTYEQVTNHWSFGWVPASASTPPGSTNSEGSTITIAPVVTGIPNTYQWYFKGNPLSDSANTDGTAHFPNDVTNESLIISEAVPTDTGNYQLVIGNPIAGAQTGQINVVVKPNTNPPVISSLTGLGTPNTSGPTPYLVKVVFSGRVDPTTGGNMANYTINPPVTMSSMTLVGSGPNDLAEESLGGDWREAILTTAGLTPGQKYSLTVSGIKDQSQTPLTIPTTTTYFRAPLLAAGVVDWDYYYLGNSSGGQVAILQADSYFPNVPQTNSYFTDFDSDQITGGDLNNNPAFGALGDNYGDSISGWITPTVTGDYTFFLWTDDGSILNLSTDSNPANATEIAYEPNAGSGFVEPTNTTPPLLDSSPITLTAGQSYFIQALHAEGGGGDYVRVAWRISTDTTPAANLLPIAGTYLSAYAPVPRPQFTSTSLVGKTLTINWSGYQGTIQQSTDLKSWSNVPGNPSPLVVNVGSAPETFYRIIQ